MLKETTNTSRRKASKSAADDARPQETTTANRSRRHDVALIVFAVVSIYLLLSLFTYSANDDAWSSVGSQALIENSGGVVGAFIADALLHAFGVLAFLIPLLTAGKILQLFSRNSLSASGNWLLRLLGLTLIASSLSALLDMSVLRLEYLPASTGGILGAAISEMFVSFFNVIGAGLLLSAVLAFGLMLFWEFSWLSVFENTGSLMLKLFNSVKRLVTSDKEVKAPEVKSEEPSLKDRMAEKKAARQAKLAEKQAARQAKLDAAAADKNISNEESEASLSENEASQIQAEKTSMFSGLFNKKEAKTNNDNSNNAVELDTNKAESDLDSSFDRWGDAPAESFAAPVNESFTSEVSNPEPAIAKPSMAAPTNNVLSAVEQQAASVAQKEVKIQPLEKRDIKQSEKAKRDLQGNLFKRGDELPSITLLDPEDTNSTHGFSEERLKELSVLLEQKLADFNIKAEVVAVAPGPVITRFEIQPAPGTKASKVSGIARDLARSLAMSSVRVVEVIPGKSVMGIEIPNEDRAIVRLSEIVASEDFDKSKSPLTMCLGHDIGGNPVVVDLAKMPHLLVAGTTGSGKSVGVNAMLISLLYKSTPADLRLILVDPKMLELSVYEGIPHLLTPVITDMKEAANGLRWSVEEMERRYQLMAAMGVRNLAGYNKKIRDAMQNGEYINDPLWRIDQSFDTTPPTLEPLPYIVVVIDEFADMMMVVGKKVEELIARIAQKARAAGIHLILATQRPSVDVITGLIKANVPTRIAFQVSSKIDSRTVLDQGGAEQLLGHGDMLFMPPGTSLPVRVHGAFVDDDEVHRVVADWKEKGEPNYIEEITQAQAEGPSIEGGDEKDDLYDHAVAFVTEAGKVSISSVQRKLRIGYNRAARLVETMEASGVVSPPAHNGQREVIAPRPR